jgi:hypothetical protein
MIVGRKEAGVFATNIDSLFKERQHGREVVCRSRSGPGIIGRGAERTGAGDVLGGDPERFFEVASCDADYVCFIRIRRETLSIGHEGVEQPAYRWVDELLVCEPVQHCALATSRYCTAPGHVGGLIPAKEGARGNKVADFQQTRLELMQHALG